MAANLNNIIVPEVFNPYVQQYTQQKSRLIQSRAVTLDPLLDAFLSGGGITTNIPSFRDLSTAAINVSTATSSAATPAVVTAANETQLRLSRNGAWKSYDLEAALAGADPMLSIAQRVGSVWARAHQAAFIATMKGVFADNEAMPTAPEHDRFDLVRNLASTNSSLTAGTQNTVAGTDTPVAYSAATAFSASAFIEAALTMGDSLDQISTIMVHSIVYGRMLKNDLISFQKDSTGTLDIPIFMGRQVIVDDSMPNPSRGVYETWLFADGAVRLGFGTPKIATETIRRPELGTGSGQEELYNRVEWCIAPVGTSWSGSVAPNAVITDSSLADGTAWTRAYSERKQIPFAKLVTREFA